MRIGDKYATITNVTTLVIVYMYTFVYIPSI